MGIEYHVVGVVFGIGFVFVSLWMGMIQKMIQGQQRYLDSQHEWLKVISSNIDEQRQRNIATSKWIQELESRIAELENKFAPTEMITGNLEDLAIVNPWRDPQYVWPNIGHAEISSTLDRQSGSPAD